MFLNRCSSTTLLFQRGDGQIMTKITFLSELSLHLWQNRGKCKTLFKVTVCSRLFIYLLRGSAGRRKCCPTAAGRGGWVEGWARPADERASGPPAGFSPTRPRTLTGRENSDAHGSGLHLRREKTWHLYINTTNNPTIVYTVSANSLRVNCKNMNSAAKTRDQYIYKRLPGWTQCSCVICGLVSCICVSSKHTQTHTHIQSARWSLFY